MPMEGSGLNSKRTSWLSGVTIASTPNSSQAFGSAKKWRFSPVVEGGGGAPLLPRRNASALASRFATPAMSVRACLSNAAPSNSAQARSDWLCLAAS